MNIMINPWILGYPIVRQTHPLMFQHSTLATMITMTHSRPIVSLHFASENSSSQTEAEQ